MFFEKVQTANVPLCVGFKLVFGRHGRGCIYGSIFSYEE
jgi:hypothetical protein